MQNKAATSLYHKAAIAADFLAKKDNLNTTIYEYQSYRKEL